MRTKPRFRVRVFEPVNPGGGWFVQFEAMNSDAERVILYHTNGMYKRSCTLVTSFPFTVHA